MPSDPSIYGGLLQPQRRRSPLETLMTLEQMDLQRTEQQALNAQRQALADQRRQEMAAAEAAAERERAGEAYIKSGNITFEGLVPFYGPKGAMEIVTGVAGLQKGDRAGIATTAAALPKLPEWMRPGVYSALRERAIKAKLAPDLPETPDEGTLAFLARLDTPATELNKPPEPKKTREIRVRMPDGSEQVQIVEDVPGFTTTSAADVPKAGTLEDYIQSYAQSRGRTVAQLSPTQKRDAKAEWESAGRAADSARFWVMRDGKAVRISESEYRPGDQPASTREQGRPVTSGDAGTVSELDTSLNDLKTLRAELGRTGTASAIGAWVPNVVTEMTGWGSDAKQRQGTIDRVKQVIGKALEGGVLRKEDEYKYTKILPTISDPPEVAKAKLDGLERALVQRRSTFLSALQDAGYETSRFDARTDAAPAATSYSVTAPNGKVYTFKTRAELDGFKKAAGIK